MYEFWLLIALSTVTSFITAAVGLGGGTIMLAVLAHVLPVKAIVPIHGVVQVGSNVGRAFVLREYINRASIIWFVIGTSFGALLGGYLVASLPANILRLLIGVFILYSVWAPSLGRRFNSTKALFFGGAVTTLLTMFVGATGPFVMALFKTREQQPIALVGTVAAAMSFQHLIKVFVFGFLGFAFYPYLSLVLFMILAGFIGTVIGKRVLIDINPKTFGNLLNWIMTVLAASLIYMSLSKIID
jgi:uncharacterized membrane protein YfcA